MKTLTQILIFTLLSFTLPAQDPEGQWTGTLSVQGIQLRIVFHVVKTNKDYKVTLDSPDQNVTGIPVTVAIFSLPNVKFEIPAIGMVYEGTLSDNYITGRWQQAGQTFLPDLALE